MLHTRLSLAISTFEIIATMAYAISGFAEARKNRLDSVGTFIIALVTAFGGGTVRDIILERRPFYWVEHQNYVIAIFILSLFSPFVLRMISRLSAERILLVADAVGLGLFSVSGTSLGLSAGMPWFSAVMMGVVTGVVGGVIRDTLCNEIPLIFRDSRPYATCAFFGGWLYVFLRQILQHDPLQSMLIAAFAILLARLITYKFDIRLPH